MGRHHHSFLDSLKSIGHQIEHAAPQILSTVQAASKFTPAGIIVSIATNPTIDKAIIGGIEKMAPSVEGALKTAGEEVISAGKGAIHQSAELRGEIGKFGKDAFNKIENFGGGLLADLKYIPYVIGGIALIWVYSKVK